MLQIKPMDLASAFFRACEIRNGSIGNGDRTRCCLSVWFFGLPFARHRTEILILEFRKLERLKLTEACASQVNR